MRACIQIHAVACEDTTQRRDTPPRVPAKHAHIQPPQVRSREGKEAARQQERRDAAARIYDRLRLEAEAKQREKVCGACVCVWVCVCLFVRVLLFLRKLWGGGVVSTSTIGCAWRPRQSSARRWV